jgi:ADP-ribose pyrophosphatase YjhB (NUDIX family)
MSRQQPLTNEEFESIYSKVPRLCVDIVLMTEDGVVLTQRQHHSWHGQWHLPGGTVLYQEKMEDTVKRVAAEELGLEVKICDLLGYVEYPSEVKERGFGWSVGIAFLCETTQSIPAVSREHEPVMVATTLPKEIVAEQRTFLKKILPDLLK